MPLTNNRLIIKTRKWLEDDEFKEILSIADYIGRESGFSLFRININKILSRGLCFEDIQDILEMHSFQYDEDVIDELLKKLESKKTVKLKYSNGRITADFNIFLGNLYKEKLNKILLYDRIEKKFYTLPYKHWELKSTLERLGFEVVDETGFRKSLPLPIKSTFSGELRDYQHEAIQSWKKNSFKGIIALPTGSGKTVIGVAALAELGERTLIIAYTKEQLFQWRDAIIKFTNLGSHMIGFYYSVEKRLAPITLSTYQTAFRYSSKLAPHFSLLIIDEVHHLPADKFKYIATRIPAAKRLGLSATPYREDGKHEELFPLMGGVVYYKPPHDLVEQGYLAPYDIITIKVDLKPNEKQHYIKLLRKYKALVGSAKFEDVLAAAKRGNRKALDALKVHSEMRLLIQQSRAKIEKVKEIINKELENGSKIIVFAHYINLAEEIAKEVGGYLLTGDISGRKRKAILDRFKRAKSGVLVVTTVGDEGLDIPDASVGILVAGTGSRRQFVQRLGRLLRPGTGKHAKLYEVVAKGTSEEAQSKRRKTLDFDITNQQT
jgi:superfamily II DNA or RNA helicase